MNLSSYFFVKNGQNHVEGDDIVSLFFKKKSKTQSESSNTSSKESLSSILEQLSKSGDYAQSDATNQQTNLKFSIKYLSTLVNSSIIAEGIMPFLLEGEFHTLADIPNLVPTGQVVIRLTPPNRAEITFRLCINQNRW